MSMPRRFLLWKSIYKIYVKGKLRHPILRALARVLSMNVPCLLPAAGFCLGLQSGKHFVTLSEAPYCPNTGVSADVRAESVKLAEQLKCLQ